MELTKNEIKDVWSRSDEYYCFTFQEFQNFSARLKQWRTINNVTQADIANAIYEYRKNIGLENDDISNVILDNSNENDSEFKPIDYDITKKRQKKREQRLTTIRRSYCKWENESPDPLFSNTPFSMTNLYVLKHIINCDYEFLFCEIPTPHKETTALSNTTGLNLSTIEKLSSYANVYKLNHSTSDISMSYTHGILVALNKLILDEELMTYISYFLTNNDIYNSNDDITITRPFTSISADKVVSKSISTKIDASNQHLIYMVTIANLLYKLRDKDFLLEKPTHSDIALDNNVILTTNEDSFGDRLLKWRKYKNLTQADVRNLIVNYYLKNNLRDKPTSSKEQKLLEDAIYRTYQNWESKKDNNKEVRISMIDLKMLHDIMECDYDYLFGDINHLKQSESTNHYLGLNVETIDKLKFYVSLQPDKENNNITNCTSQILKAIDLIVSNNELLENLAFFLSDLHFDVNMNSSSILRPIEILGINDTYSDAYANLLFPEGTDLKNVFLPAIFEGLSIAREKNKYNNQPIIDKLNQKYPS